MSTKEVIPLAPAAGPPQSEALAAPALPPPAAPAPFDVAAKKEALRASVITSYQEAYKERCDNWKTVETKAQGTIAVAGIFIAGAFAFIERSASVMTGAQRGLAAVALSALVLGVLLAVRALKIRETPPPPLGEFMRLNVEPFLEIEAEDELKERVEYFDYDMMKEWQSVTSRMDALILEKANQIAYAQTSLVFAVIVVAILAISRVFVR